MFGESCKTAVIETCHSIDKLARVLDGRRVALAMGFFDGVHLGHRRVIEAAQAEGAVRAVMSFANHPASVLRPDAHPNLLTPDPQYKNELLEQLGVQVHLCMPFTRELADTAAEPFLDTLRRVLNPACLSVGSNWHFGSRGSGNAETLRAYGARHGIAVAVNELLERNGERVSSSLIRTLLAAGRLDEAAALLGHPFCISGTVEHGQHLARSLGFPTANITLPPHAATPPFGVYAVSADVDGQTLCGIANLGLRPTINEAHKCVRLEVHFTNWSGDLYGSRLTVALIRFIRPEQKFASLDELREAIHRDVSAAQECREFACNRGLG